MLLDTDNMKRTLVLYLYKEDPRTLANLKFFIRNGFTEAAHTHYLFIINDFKCSADFPGATNITIIKKSNSYDLGAYKYALDAFEHGDYEFFIFINSSCIGPILPEYVTCPWHDIVTGMLTDSIKLVAPIIEVPNDDFGRTAIETLKFISDSDTNIPFLHTYMFATDSTGLEILLRYRALTSEDLSQENLIHRLERLITSSILNEGFGVKCLLLKYKNVDFRLKENWIASRWVKGKLTCPEVPGNYDGIDVQPLEVMFTKNIRRKHAFRSFKSSGISRTLSRYLEKYVAWSVD